MMKNPASLSDVCATFGVQYHGTPRASLPKNIKVGMFEERLNIYKDGLMLGTYLKPDGMEKLRELLQDSETK